MFKNITLVELATLLLEQLVIKKIFVHIYTQKRGDKPLSYFNK